MVFRIVTWILTVIIGAEHVLFAQLVRQAKLSHVLVWPLELGLRGMPGTQPFISEAAG